MATNAVDAAVVESAKAPETSKEVTPPPEWKQEFERVISQRDSLKKAKVEAETKVAQYEAEKAAHEAKQAIRREEEANKQMAEKGQYVELLAKKDKQREDAIRDIKLAVQKTVLPIWIKAAASEISNLTPEARKDLPFLLKEYIKVDEFGNATVTENGLPKLDDGGKPVDPIDFIKTFVQARSYMILDAMPKSHGGSGSGAEASKGAKSIEAMMESHDNKALAEWQTRDPAGFTASLNDYTKSLSKKARNFKK